MKGILIDALVDLYQNGPRASSLGICWHVVKGLDDTTHGKAALAMYDLFQRWPEYSGIPHYPVPGAEGERPSAAFNHAEDLWSGSYGAKRWALAEFMLRELCK